MRIKHSKFKNTGLIFELLTRQVASDTLKGEKSPAIDILKKHFAKTSLGREYKLYESLLKAQNLSEAKANIVIDSILENSKSFSRTSLKRQKYNLINEIKNYYDLDVFFSSKVKNYKELAALYTLIESKNQPKNDLNQVISNKNTLLEFLVKKPKQVESQPDLIKEFSSYDKDLRSLTYRVLLEKFNTKYDNISIEQKEVLREYINSVDSMPNLRNFYNDKINLLKENLQKETEVVKDKAVKIKLNEVLKYLKPKSKQEKICDNDLVDLLQYIDLKRQLKSSNSVKI